MNITFHHSLSPRDRATKVLVLLTWTVVPVYIFYYLFVTTDRITILDLFWGSVGYLISILYLMKQMRLDTIKVANGILIQDSGYVGLFYRTEINLKDVKYFSYQKNTKNTYLLFYGTTVEKINISGWKQDEIEYFKNFLVRDFNLSFK